MLYPVPTTKTNELKLPLLIHMIGVNHKTENYYCPHGRQNFQLFFCLKGEGEVTLNNQRTLIRENYGFLIYPEEPYHYNAISDDWRLDHIEFNGSLAHEILQTLGMTESQNYIFFDKETFHKHITKIYQMQKKDPLPDNESFSKICYDLLIDIPKSTNHIHRGIDMDTAISENDLVMKIVTYMELHYAENISLDDLADYVQLTKGYMCTLFKRTVGLTIITELTYMRMGRARIFLTQYPEKSVVEIAKMCGFDNAGYFGKVFKKITGETPDQYRRKNHS